MEKIKELIANNTITLDDIDAYLESINISIIDSSKLQVLEDSFANHPG